MNGGLQPPSALAIVRELVRGQEPEVPAPPTWLVIVFAIAVSVGPVLVVLQ